MWLDEGGREETLLEVRDPRKTGRLTNALRTTFVAQKRWGVLYIDSEQGPVVQRSFDGR